MTEVQVGRFELFRRLERCIRLAITGCFLPRAAFLALVFMLAPPSMARADIPDFMWEPVEDVDDSVESVSSSSGISVVFSDGLWHIVYEKLGDIVHVERADTGWRTPEPLTSDPWPSRNPHVAAGSGFLHVVWEDDRLGHTEVWTRRRDTNGWSAEECLSCDLIPSRGPVIAGNEQGTFVAWQDDSIPHRHVRGRLFETTWGPLVMVSTNSADAFEPTVSAVEYSGIFVAWTDARDGPNEIYLRDLNQWDEQWGPERRITTLGGCGRPSIHAELCCGDLVAPTWLVAFERNVGVIETFIVDQFSDPRSLSAVDGVPSTRPNVGGFAHYFLWSFGGPSPRYFVTWTDRNGPLPAVHPLELVSMGQETLSFAGLSTSVVGATEGNPLAAVLGAWIESRGGIPTLVTRAGRLPGVTAVDGPTSAGELELAVNPNPCRTSTVVQGRVPQRTDVALRILDIAGRSVREWASRPMEPGSWSIPWDARDAAGKVVPPGLYFAAARIGSARLVRPFVVMR